VQDQATRIVIKGVGGYDGEYELDTERAFNTREWNWIKRIAGYMPNTIKEGLAGGDPDLYVAISVIAMCRAGKIERNEGIAVAEILAEAPFQLEGGAIQVIFPDEDDSPLASTSEPEPQSVNGSLEKQTSSGPDSPTSSAPSDVIQQPIGIGG